MSVFRTLLIIFALLHKIELVSAYSSGAGSCESGDENVDGQHESGTVTSGRLSKGSYTMTVGGVEVTDGAVIRPTSNDFTISVQGPTFKGVLIRVGGTKSAQVTTGSTYLQHASACGRVGGITHKDGSPKTSADAIVSLSKADNHRVDITVVVACTGTVSTYYYSSFFINGKVNSK